MNVTALSFMVGAIAICATILFIAHSFENKGRKQEENDELKDQVAAAKDRAKIDDSLSKLDPDDKRRMLDKWVRGPSSNKANGG